MKTHISIALFTICFALPTSAMSKKPATSPLAQQSPAVDGVWVGKSDQAVACATERGIDLDVMAKDLKTAGVTIYEKKKLHDGKMRIQTCGVDKGDMNGYLIPKSDLNKAKTHDFITVE